MPGNLWQVSCGSCRASWEVQAGARPGRSFVPATCPRCAAVVTAEDDDGGGRRAECASVVWPLPGARLRPGRALPDGVGVACPVCAAEGLQAVECGRWD